MGLHLVLLAAMVISMLLAVCISDKCMAKDLHDSALLNKKKEGYYVIYTNKKKGQLAS